MNVYAEAVKDVSMILLIIGSAGILKQIFMIAGQGKELPQQYSSGNCRF
jgi:Gnt-I system high-affinity gluconate transporter